jgi:hypothetical protein
MSELEEVFERIDSYRDDVIKAFSNNNMNTMKVALV